MRPGGTLTQLIRAKQDGCERRRLQRHSGTGLVARFGDGVAEVLDISLGGIRLALSGDCGRAATTGQGEAVSFLIANPGAPRHRPGAQGVSATAVVVEAGEHDLHLRFVGMTYPLAQVIIAHIASVSGVSPYIFR